jgi:hypothetical protein
MWSMKFSGEGTPAYWPAGTTLPAFGRVISAVWRGDGIVNALSG